MNISQVKQWSSLQRLMYWINEREAIRRKKVAGKPRPWTDDAILHSYKFCNVYREEDRVTKWIAEHWREPNEENANLWFAMAVARWINWPDTLAEVGYPYRWHPKQFQRVLERRAARGEKVWGGAYMLATHGHAIPKPQFITCNVLGALYAAARGPKQGETLASYARHLQQQYGFKGFMTGQVIADLKYVEPLRSARDWTTWAISGPGSRRGMNRLLDMPVKTKLEELVWKENLEELVVEVRIKAMEWRYSDIHAQDLQNCLCEWDKYERTLWGEGRPKCKYP